MKILRCVLFSLAFLMANATTLFAEGQSITELVVFGESSSDTGNVFDLFCGDPLVSDAPCLKEGYALGGEFVYYNGRLSNGPLWIDRLAELLGVASPEPSRTGGTNYAHAGAKSFIGTNHRISLLYGTPLTQEVPQIGTQISSFMTDYNQFDTKQLAVIWGGANDLRDISSPAGVFALVGTLFSHIQTVIDIGADQVLVLNQFPVDLAPFFLGATEVQKAQIRGLVVGFNEALQAAVGYLKAENPLSRIHFVDAYGIALMINDAPLDYGFTNVLYPALDLYSGFIVANPDESIFWDVIHPTTKFYTQFAEIALDNIVNDLLGDLLNSVGGIILTGNNESARASLETKLNGAMAKFSQGKIEAAIGKLKAFKNKVNSLLVSGDLFPNEAMLLNSDVDYTIGLLGQLQL